MIRSCAQSHSSLVGAARLFQHTRASLASDRCLSGENDQTPMQNLHFGGEQTRGRKFEVAPSIEKKDFSNGAIISFFGSPATSHSRAALPQNTRRDCREHRPCLVVPLGVPLRDVPSQGGLNRRRDFFTSSTRPRKPAAAFIPLPKRNLSSLRLLCRSCSAIASASALCHPDSISAPVACFDKSSPTNVSMAVKELRTASRGTRRKIAS